jgi:phosphatidate cytidylyltransferase
MKQRVATALLITPLAIAMILLLPTAAFAIIISGLCLLALWEWTRLSGLRDRRYRSALLVIAIIVFGALWIWHGTWPWWIVIATGCAWWIVALYWLRHYTFAAAATPGNSMIKLLVGGLAIFPAWAALMQIHGSAVHGPAWALYALALGWSADTFAYLAGSRWGRKKLAPNISPGKTIVGVYGAMAGTAVVAVIGGCLLGVHNVQLIPLAALALICVAFSIIGDLFESLIKRHANVKDSGALFPGHGGVFDRLDSAFAVLPIFAIGKTLLGL